MKQCFICEEWANTEEHHIFGGTANRKISDKYKLVVDLCPNCHQYGKKAVHKNEDMAQFLHEYGQRKFMREQGVGIAEFVRIFGRNYLDESW